MCRKLARIFVDPTSANDRAFQAVLTEESMNADLATPLFIGLQESDLTTGNFCIVLPRCFEDKICPSATARRTNV